MQELVVPTTYTSEKSKYIGVCMPSYPITDGDKNWVNRFSFQQFTGLTDKNGVEIYEGDVITYREKMDDHGDVQQLSGQIVYDPKRAAFGIGSPKSGEIWNYFTDMTVSDFEVVGNAFETKNE